VPRHMPARRACRATAGRAPFGPAVRPRFSTRVHRTTVVIHAAVTSRPGQDYLSASILTLPAPDRRSLPLPPPSVNLQRRALSPPANRPTRFPRPLCTSQGHLLSKPSTCRRQDRATAAAAVGPCRTSTPACSPPQICPPPGPR
jgi:hypothetical protein